MDHQQSEIASKYMNQIDQVLVAPWITEQQTIDCCDTAIALQVSNVWVKPCYVHKTINNFHSSSLKIGTFIGYPYGVNSTYVKMAETKRALSEGVDMIVLSPNVGDIIAGNFTAVLEEIKCVSGLARMNSARCLVLVDFSLLEISLVQRLADIVANAGVDRVVFQVESGEELHFDQLRDLIELIKKKKLSASLHIHGPVPLEALEVVLDAGFDRVGMQISMENYGR